MISIVTAETSHMSCISLPPWPSVPWPKGCTWEFGALDSSNSLYSHSYPCSHSIHSTTHPLIYPSCIHLSICHLSSTRPFIFHLPIHSSIYLLFIHPSTHSSLYSLTHLFIPSIHLSNHLFHPLASSPNPSQTCIPRPSIDSIC